MKRVKKALLPAYAATLGHLPASWSIAIEYLRRVGRWPDLNNPKTFNEKIQWRKLHGDHALYARLSDKVVVKDHVAAILGDDFVTPTLWHGFRLPPLGERNWPFPYVIKANHDSGSIMFVRNEMEQDWDRIDSTCAGWLRTRFGPHLQEKWYHTIDPQILVEPNLGENLLDYKFYVFDGRVHYIHVDTDRFIGHKRRFYDRDWEPLPFSLRFPRETRDIERPVHLKEMVAGAECLGAGFDFVRVDFYDLPDGPKFGELTFSPGSGYETFDPPEYDDLVGDNWKIRPFGES